MPADGMSAAAEKMGLRRPRRQLVHKATPAAPGLKGAHDVPSWPVVSFRCYAASASLQEQNGHDRNLWGRAQVQDDLPDGLIFRNRVKPSREKYFSSVFRKIMRMIDSSRLDARGERVVTIARRDAMDAGALARRAA
jgi:hypothetical protein